MNARAFYEKVKEMRKAQQCCISVTDKTEKQYWLEEKQRLESEIDAEIDRVEEILRKREESRKQIDNAIKILNDKGFGLIEVNK